MLALVYYPYHTGMLEVQTDQWLERLRTDTPSYIKEWILEEVSIG